MKRHNMISSMAIGQAENFIESKVELARTSVRVKLATKAISDYQFLMKWPYCIGFFRVEQSGFLINRLLIQELRTD